MSVRNLLITVNDRTSVQFFRYFFVGGLAFIIDYGLLIFFTEIFKIYYLISATISFLCGLVVNYTISIFWVFKTMHCLCGSYRKISYQLYDFEIEYSIF